MCAIAFATASLHPLDRAVDDTMAAGFFTAHSWIAFQILTINLPLLLVFLAIARWVPRWATAAGMICTAMLPLLVLGDCLVFHLIGERLLSATTSKIILTLLPGLLPYINAGTFLGFTLGVLSILAVGVVLWLLVRRLAARWSVGQRGAVSPLSVVLILVAIATICAGPVLRDWDRTLAAMAEHSSRHPWCAVGWVHARGVGVSAPVGDDAVISQLRGLSLAPEVRRRARQLRLNVIRRTPSSPAVDELPDVLIIICESFRPELLRREVMPQLTTMADRGLWMRNHFSGGNASNLGVFSLLNGLESIWFYRAEARRSPTFNRLFHQAGYELGFFAGHDDWSSFQMDDFINSDQYDRLEIEACQWLASDRRAIDSAQQFLKPDDTRAPRAAVLFLYSTHGPFDVDARFALDQPAVGRNYISPYSPVDRPAVWNRYRNAARSLDAALAPLLIEDRLTVLAGDHGEAFLEDGTTGHGTRLSRVQNMTPAVIAGPGIKPTRLGSLSMHADILPTLISAAGLQVSRPDLFDGVDLRAVPQASLQERIFATANYMNRTVLLVGPGTLDPQRPFGHRCEFSIFRWRAAALNPISPDGLQWPENGSELTQGTAGTQTDEVFSQWLLSRFGTDPTQIQGTAAQWLQRQLQSDNANDRLTAIEAVRAVEQPQPELISLVAGRLHDREPAVRRRARAVVIELRKRAR